MESIEWILHSFGFRSETDLKSCPLRSFTLTHVVWVCWGCCDKKYHKHHSDLCLHLHKASSVWFLCDQISSFVRAPVTLDSGPPYTSSISSQLTASVIITKSGCILRHWDRTSIYKVLGITIQPIIYLLHDILMSNWTLSQVKKYFIIWEVNIVHIHLK